MTMLAPSSAQIRAIWTPLAQLSDIADEWRALASRALQKNVFYEPDFALPAATAFGADVGAVTLRSSDDRLIGLFPTRVEPYRYGVIPGVASGWTHAYAPLGLPLVDKDHAEKALSAWLDHLANEQHIRFLLIPFLPRDGDFVTTLNLALQARGASFAEFGIHRRALFAPARDRAAYLESTTSHKSRKEFARRRRRLADRGDVAFSYAKNASEVAKGLDDFLDLESKGWKGRAQTAALVSPEIRNFVTHAVTGLAAHGQAGVARLSLNGRAIAVLVLLQSGDLGWAWKIAFDESLSRLSPGVQLMRDVTQALVEDTSLQSVDSCATPDHPMIDHIWRQRLALSDRLIALRPGDHAGLKFVSALETLRRSAASTARKLRDGIARR